jgi:uncharacterized protein (TIGR02588 family)
MAHQGTHAGSHTSRPEWIVAIISTILVLFVLGYTTYEGLTRGSAPPLLHVQVDSVVQTGEVYVVAFSIGNEGDATAAGVQVEGTLRDGDAVLERSDVRFDFVPVDAVRSGALLFTRDPRQHALRVRPVGYERP